MRALMLRLTCYLGVCIGGPEFGKLPYEARAPESGARRARILAPLPKGDGKWRSVRLSQHVGTNWEGVLSRCLGILSG